MNRIYDDRNFFEAYAQMPRSKDGLALAGEWHQLQPLFPPLRGKSVLDLGCGYGWHCKYAAEQGASSVLGLDLSHRMIEEAKKRNSSPNITYRVCGIEEYEHPVFTAGINQDWIYSEDGTPKAWPVDDYFYPGERQTAFLGHNVPKQHHTLTQIIMGIINAGFTLEHIEEAQPSETTISLPGMKDEMRRPMMLLVKAGK